VGYFSQAKAGRDDDGHNETGKNSIDSVSTLGPGMLITGNIICEGSAHIFGRVIGDIQAAQIVIGDGAQVEGNITAHEVGITGAFEGTIRGNNVRLKGAAKIDGEVFSKSLTVEENVQFEGLSRRFEKPIELPSPAQTGALKPVLASKADSGSISDRAPPKALESGSPKARCHELLVSPADRVYRRPNASGVSGRWTPPAERR
jgi:cytoskeletal protein CcmA (bactofilin family)